MGSQKSRGLVIAPKAGLFLVWDRLAVDCYERARQNANGGRCQHNAVQSNATLGNQLLRISARANAGARDDFGYALALAALLATFGHEENLQTCLIVGVVWEGSARKSVYV